jgi:hypothetical protein
MPRFVIDSKVGKIMNEIFVTSLCHFCMSSFGACLNPGSNFRAGVPSSPITRLQHFITSKLMGWSIWRVNDSVSQMLGARLRPGSHLHLLVSNISIVFDASKREHEAQSSG